MEMLIIALVLESIMVMILAIVLIVKTNSKKDLSNVYDGIETMQDDVYFSKAVKQYYLEVIKEPNKYYVKNCTMQKEGKSCSTSIVIWTSNGIDSRRFYTHDKDREKEVNELNSKLTHYDKELLDRLARGVKNRNIKIEEKIFF